ncbi:MAG TPA: MerR family transcriptional regulator, partial [Ktedonobacteraceae bacterium]|nr:MerR family transcriptional regulator [Ktedonobacteraceae bacterium]
MASHVYTTAEVVRTTGFSHKQLDYWASTGLLVPSEQQSHGPGTRRLYSVDDLVQLQFIRHLKSYGWSTRKIGQVVYLLTADGKIEEKSVEKGDHPPWKKC